MQGLLLYLRNKTTVTKSVEGMQSRALDPFAPRFDSVGRVQVYIFPVSRNAVLPSMVEISALGGVKIVISAPLQVVQAWIPVNALKTLTALPDVGRVTVPVMPGPRIPSARQMLSKTQDTIQAMPQGVQTGLAIDADAVQAMQADQLQQVNAQGAGDKSRRNF